MKGANYRIPDTCSDCRYSDILGKVPDTSELRKCMWTGKVVSSHGVCDDFEPEEEQ